MVQDLADDKSILVQVMAWRHQRTESMLTQIYVAICHYGSISLSDNVTSTISYTNNSLLPNDTIWCEWFRSTLVPLMVSPYFMPSHYLDQCRIIVKWPPGVSFQWIRILNFKHFCRENVYKLISVEYRLCNWCPQTSVTDITVLQHTVVQWYLRFTVQHNDTSYLGIAMTKVPAKSTSIYAKII